LVRLWIAVPPVDALYRYALVLVVFALLVNATVSWVVFAAVTPVIVGGVSGVPEITILVAADVV
jgi:hypothetical protein